MFIQDRKQFGNLILIINNKNGKGKEKKLIFFHAPFHFDFHEKKEKKGEKKWTEQAPDVEL